MNSENLLLRAYNRIADDKYLQSFLGELMPMLSSPSGCLEVLDSTTSELMNVASGAILERTECDDSELAILSLDAAMALVGV